MEIHFRNIHEAVSQRILDRTEARLKKLAKLADEDQFASHAYVEIGRAVGSHHTGDIWKAVINIDIKGGLLRTEAAANHPELAATRALGEMKSELRQSRSKDKMLRRKQHSIWKSFNNFGLRK